MKILDLIGKLWPFPEEERDKEYAWFDLYGNNIEKHLDYPEGSMYDAFKAACKKYPGYCAYSYFGKKVKYKKFDKKIEKAAKGLKNIGFKKGDTLTICMPNTPEAITMFYAVNKIGGICSMIHPLSSENEIEYYLNKSNSKYLLCLDMCYPKVNGIIENTKIEKTIIATISKSMPLIIKTLYSFKKKKVDINYDTNLIRWKKFIRKGKKYKGSTYESVTSDDDAVILYSGGTTGCPKGAVLSNLNFNALATQCFEMTDPAKAGDRVLTIMPIFHGFGIGVCVHTELISGMNIILIPQFNAREFSKLIKKYKPTFLAGVPTMYEALINSKEKKKNYLKSVTNVICGGDVLNETLQKKVDAYLKKYGSIATIRVGYGLTECTGASCLTPRFYFKEGAIGVPFPDMIYKIVQPGTSKECAPFERGEICISGPTVMKKYIDDEKETSNKLKLHDDKKIWLHTEDVGYMDDQGIVFFESRLKRMIVSSGYNIYPQYIEKIIQSYPAVESCIVVGIPHPYKHEVPKAYIVLRDNFKLDDNLKKDIKKYVEKSVAIYAMPKEYEFVSELPKTLVGKVAFTKLGKKKGK